MAKAKKKTRRSRERSERRFLGRSNQSPALVMAVGALGSLALGAGVYGQIWGHFERPENQTVSPLTALSAGGALLLAVAIWLGTTAEPAIRVGDPGIAVERGELRRIPWYQVSSITWESGNEALVVSGKDEQGQALTVKLGMKSHHAAAALILDEAERRASKALEVSSEVRARIGEPDRHAGTAIALEPLQVVGKRCAKSNRVIAYEPDARVCPQCERVYHKAHVPRRCKCGASLGNLRVESEQEENEAEEDG